MILTASEGGIYGAVRIRRAPRPPARSRSTGVAARCCSRSREHGVARMLTADARPSAARRSTTAGGAQTPGGLDRNAGRWQLQLLDREHQRDGMSGLFHLVHADGYVSYRVKSDWNEDRRAQRRCGRRLRTVHARGPRGAVAGAARHGPLRDDRELPRAAGRSAAVPAHRPATGRARPRSSDGLWVRPLDVCALLSARRYAVEVDAGLQVRDPLLGDATYRLRGGPDGAACERTDSRPDVDLGVAELGAISLGGTRLAPLVARGASSALTPRLPAGSTAPSSPTSSAAVRHRLLTRGATEPGNACTARFGLTSMRHCVARTALAISSACACVRIATEPVPTAACAYRYRQAAAQSSSSCAASGSGNARLRVQRGIVARRGGAVSRRWPRWRQRCDRGSSSWLAWQVRARACCAAAAGVRAARSRTPPAARPAAPPARRR